MAVARRPWLFRIHAWIGLNLGFLLFLVCFSGTVAVYSVELNWLADPSLRVAPPSGAARTTMSWQDLHDRVAQAHPGALTLYLSAPRGDRSVARATIAYSPRDVRSVLINPYTGAIQGLKSGFDLESFFRIFHKQLYIVPAVYGVHGTLIVGALGIVLLLGVITGLLSIKRWWRAFLTLRRGRSRRLFWSDLHRLAGIWALLVSLVLSLTGIWYLAERILFDAGALTEEGRSVQLGVDDLRHRPPILVPLDLDRAVALARLAYPELTISHISLPVRPADPLVFIGQSDAWLVRDRANQVHMDPYTGRILRVQHAADLGPFERWIETADPLHFGTFAGPLSQIVWFATGLMMSGGILAGLLSAWLRQRQRRGRTRKHRIGAIAAILPALVLLIVSVYGTYAYGGAALNSAQHAVSVVPLAQRDLGPWKISIVRLDRHAERSKSIELRLLFEGEGRPNFERAELSLPDSERSTEIRPALQFVDRLLGRATCPDEARSEECQLTMTIGEWNGVQHSLSVDLRPHSTATGSFDLPVATGVAAGEIAVIIVFVVGLLLPFLFWARLQFV